MGRGILSWPETGRIFSILRHSIPDRRDQCHLLPFAGIDDGSGLAGKGAIRFPLCGERQPLYHPYQTNDLGRTVGNFTRRVQPLREKLGPLLWQLPPNFKPDLPRLDRFLKKLPKQFSHAVEFRHPDWFAEPAFALLRKYQVASVSMSSLRMPMNFTVTANIIYIRFHGLKDGPRHDYTRGEMQPWAEHIQQQAQAGKDVFVYFNNDLNVRAPNNAKSLMEMCGERVVYPGK